MIVEGISSFNCDHHFFLACLNPGNELMYPYYFRIDTIFYLLHLLFVTLDARSNIQRPTTSFAIDFSVNSIRHQKAPDKNIFLLSKTSHTADGLSFVCIVLLLTTC